MVARTPASATIARPGSATTLTGYGSVDERLGDRATERLERRDRLGVVRREAAADIEQREAQTLDAGRPHDVPGQCDPARVGRRIE